MSRSRRKTPITGMTTCDSEKEDKRIANRMERHANKILLSDLDETRLKDRREVSDPWLMGKDGRQWIDTNEYPKLMRK